MNGDPVPDVPLLAGMGGMNSSQHQTAHAGRRAILLSRNDDTGEYESLASTLGVEIVAKIIQRGKPNPRSYLGSGKLQEIAEEMEMSGPGHLWHRVDLVLIHDNLKSSQLVNINDALTIETWDRVRLLLELFTRHASSAEARIQVRIARLLADRSILRELTNRETMGERLGYGAGGQTGWNNIMKAVGYEITRLRRRLSKLDASMSERRRQRSRSGALTVGLAGYTNVGKSSLFNSLSGKAVLIRDQVFSTLETTVGRMENKPRILMVDTIGFIDNVPAELLDSFSATLQESLSCDMLLLLVDASNMPDEIRRKLATSSREVSGRIKSDSSPNTIVVLTKTDLCTAEQLQEAKEIVHHYSPFEVIPVSTMSGEGIEQLRSVILTQLHGPPVQVNIIHPEESSEIELAALVARVHRDALVIDIEVDKELTKIYGWIDIASQSRLTKEFPTQINISGKS